MELAVKIEGVLFYKAAPMKKTALMKLFEVTEEELGTALEALKTHLENGATRIIDTGSEVDLVSASELDELIEGLRKDEMKRDIGKAGAETLAIVLYRGPVTRAEIDRIRGVNSSFILRNLMVRGLVERNTNTKQVQFQVTPALMGHMGITDKTKAPAFAEIMNVLEAYETKQESEPAQ